MEAAAFIFVPLYVLSITWPVILVGGVLWIGLVLRYHRKGQLENPLELFEYGLYFLFPLAMILWAVLFFSANEGAFSRGWESRLLDLFLWLDVLAVLGLVYRHRGKIGLALVSAGMSLSLVAGIWFIGIMAVANDWI